MVFVALLVPPGLYLLYLGWLNRQPRPVLVSGTWDFIGVLFAASGFLLVCGPAALSSSSERVRMFWLFGEADFGPDGLAAARLFDLLLAAAYLVAVFVISLVTLMGRRSTTSIYNVEPGVIEIELDGVCERLGLEVVRSDNVFIFVPAGTSNYTVLEVESFGAMKHATLKWVGAATPQRKAVEAELARRLDRAGAAYHETGVWMTLAGTAMLGLSLLIALALVLRTLYLR